MSSIKKNPNSTGQVHQLTFIRKQNIKRPKTSSLKRASTPLSGAVFLTQGLPSSSYQTDPMKKIKALKAQVKRTQQQYLLQLRNVKQSQKFFNANYREAQRKKVDFLKLYQTKKVKTMVTNLQTQCLTERTQVLQKNRQHAKRLKMQQQIKRIISRSQKQANLQKFRQKQILQKKKFLQFKQQKNQRLNENTKQSFLKIKTSQQQLKERRKQIKSLSQSKAKQDYWRRIKHQIMYLTQYQQVMKDLQAIVGMDKDNHKGNSNNNNLSSHTFSNQEDRGFVTCVQTSRN